MATLSKYISDLKNIETSFKKEVEGYVYKRGTILRSVKLRLFRGKDGDLKMIGDYAPSTIARKKKKGQITKYVNLRDTGNWYKDLFLKWDKDELMLENKDLPLTSKLIDGEYKFKGYGDAILELSQKEVDLVDKLVDEYIAVMQKKILDQQIDLEF